MDTNPHLAQRMSNELPRENDHRQVSMDRHRRREHSPEQRPRHKSSSKYERSRSQSLSPRRRSDSRSPAGQNRKRNHDKPPKSRCLGVFGLNVYTTKSKILQIFEKFGPLERVQVVFDAKTGRSRGYCFVYFENTNDAKVAKEQCTGMELDSRIIRVDYSITQRAHSPTPGVYKGQLGRYERERFSRYRDEQIDDHHGRSDRRYSRERRSPSYHSRDRRSPSYHSRDRRRRYERSYSRSYSPRDRRYR